MKLRPTIFLSGVSSEFGSFRDAVEVEVQKKGCFAENQSSFGVDYHTVEEMLRRRINDADAVIHIVGFRFGAEPTDRPANKPRRSYTQMEYDIALELGKPLYAFLSSDATIGDAVGTDDAEATALQLAHRQAIQESKPLYYFFKDKAELCKLAGEIDTVAHAEFRFEISRIDKYAPAELIGREDELALLNDAWLKVRRAEASRAHVLTFVALGGEGKTSLVAKWLANLAFQNWPGCDSAFAWSFYSQGTREQYAASSDLFLKEAITFFGDDADKEFAASAAGAYEKGQRLARIVGQRRALLILDGLEPLQYAPASPTPGELKDGGITALLKGLAARSDGLCIVTTRYSLPNLKAFWQTTAPEIALTRLSRSAGIHLLKTLGVKGSTTELEKLVEDVKGHALTLNLLGTYLRDAHGGDVRRRDLIKLEEADAEEQGGHAFRVMEAYERAFQAEGSSGIRALALLRMLSIFDHPVSADSLEVLLRKPPISGLTESLVGLSDAPLNLGFRRLEHAKLLTINRDPSNMIISVDAHPLLREYFARQLKTKQLETWRATHKRLYKHLCDTTPHKSEPTLEDLQPLYQAVVHGCQAGLQKEACDSVYYFRINRGEEYYSVMKLGAYASDLAALACFFESPWTQVSDAFTEPVESWLLNEAATRLRALGRLTEALTPILASERIRVTQRRWSSAALSASNLSQLELTLGKVVEAVRDGENSVMYAERDDNEFQQMVMYVTHAQALHQAGHLAEAKKRFLQAERLQSRVQREYPLLYSIRGFVYCDLLLSTTEQLAWRRTIGCSTGSLPKAVRTVSKRAARTLGWSQTGNLGSLMAVALDRLTLARISLYEVLLSEKHFKYFGTKHAKLNTQLDAALNSIRHAGLVEFVSLGLLTRAWLHVLMDDRTATERAQENLNEAWEIAERGPMRLHMADIHLYRARLFFREKEYPWESPEADLAAARKLIEQCGYWRRKEELEDAERVILQRSA